MIIKQTYIQAVVSLCLEKWPVHAASHANIFVSNYSGHIRDSQTGRLAHVNVLVVRYVAELESCLHIQTPDLHVYSRSLSPT